MLKKLLENERAYLNDFFEKIEMDKLQNFLDFLLSCQGIIILTGIGKSGLVAEKVAMTMNSTGSRALFLSPVNAMHGDMGFVNAQDVVIMMSKSGETDELVHLIPFLRNKGARMSAIVSNPHSRIAKAVDQILVLPHEREICPYDLAPTTSTVIQSIIGDVLAVALMETKKFSRDEFALNHPAGRLGRRMLFRVRDLMITGKGIPICKPEDKIVDTLVELSDKRCGCVLIVDDENELLGVFTDGDLRRILQKAGPDSLHYKIGDAMTRSPKWIGVNELAITAMRKMEEDQKHPVMILPVLDDFKKVAGLIKMHDLVQIGI